MSHDGQITTLKSLRLYGMAQALGELAHQGSPICQNAQPMLDTLLKAEVAEREVRSVSYQMKSARFVVRACKREHKHAPLRGCPSSGPRGTA